MKACRRYKKFIAWKVTGALEPDLAEALAEHLTTCPGCRAYDLEVSLLGRELQTAGSTSQAETTEWPEGRRRREGHTEPAGLWTRRGTRRVASRREGMGWFAGAFAAVLTMLIVGLLLMLERADRGLWSTIPMDDGESRPTNATSNDRVLDRGQTTLAEYRRAALSSPEEFDRLLTRSGGPSADVGETFNVASALGTVRRELRD